MAGQPRVSQASTKIAKNMKIFVQPITSHGLGYRWQTQQQTSPSTHGQLTLASLQNSWMVQWSVDVGWSMGIPVAICEGMRAREYPALYTGGGRDTL